MLVAAFRATLEEVIEANLILHVRDVSHGDAEAQSGDVREVLKELGVDPDSGKLIEVWNKVDNLPRTERERLTNLAKRQVPPPVLVSALTGEGMDALKAVIEDKLGATRKTFEVTLEAAEGASASWLYRNTEVLDKAVNEEGAQTLKVRVDPSNEGLLAAKFGSRVKPVV
jgi:GTP-binding protein HflX